MGMTRLGTPAESCCTVNAVSKGASKKSTTVPVSVVGAMDSAGDVVRNTLFDDFSTSSLTTDTDLVTANELGVGNNVDNIPVDVDVANVTAAVLGEEVGNATVGLG